MYSKNGHVFNYKTVHGLVKLHVTMQFYTYCDEHLSILHDPF